MDSGPPYISVLNGAKFPKDVMICDPNNSRFLALVDIDATAQTWDLITYMLSYMIIVG